MEGHKHSRINSVEGRSKLYTGELYQPLGRHVEPQEELIKPFPSDTECWCIIKIGNEKVPDYECEDCEGTGKNRSYSLYEKTIRGNKGI